MLGIFATGRRYVPLDAGSPVPRAAAMLEAADAAVVLTDRRYEGHARAIAGPRQAILDVEAARAAEASDPPRSFPTDTALWVMHTSGSTGEPKGVVQTHRNLLHYIRNYANGLRLGPDDRLLTLMRITVNGGCHDALMALLTGGTLLLWDAKRDGLHPLPEWIARQGATILSAAPTVFRHLVAGSATADTAHAQALGRTVLSPRLRRLPPPLPRRRGPAQPPRQQRAGIDALALPAQGHRFRRQ
jgi:acyl-CoA synthetase (AMP-forming)/AMP-acid ligase II